MNLREWFDSLPEPIQEMIRAVWISVAVVAVILLISLLQGCSTTAPECPKIVVPPVVEVEVPVPPTPIPRPPMPTLRTSLLDFSTATVDEILKASAHDIITLWVELRAILMMIDKRNTAILEAPS